MQRKKYDVISLGIAVVDIIAYPIDKNIFDKDKALLEEVRIAPGGDAVNQSVTFGRLGDRVSLCCRLGDDTLGRLLINEISIAGVDTSTVAVSAESFTSAAIVLVAKNGERSIVSKKGNNYDFCIDDVDMDAIADTRALSVASFFGISKLEKHGLKEILMHAKANGSITFADCGADKKNEGLDALAQFLPHLDCFMPSEVESTHLTGERDPVKASAKLKALGVKNVVIKLGKNGAYADCGEFKGYLDPFSITPTDTTGAGDAFCAGFIHSILAGKDTKDALEFANACGAFTATHFGATSAETAEETVERFIANTPKRMIY